MSKIKMGNIKRYNEIIRKLTKYGFARALVIAKLKKSSTKKFGSPKQAKNLLESLGGLFTKLGQFLSLRPDLIPEEYCKEFGKLQDEVKPFSKKEATEILKEQLGLKSKQIKLVKLIASASIGQAYEAKIGKSKLAIKIQRPNVNEIFNADLSILYFLAQSLKKHMKSDVIDPMEIYEQFHMYTLDELDYRKEAKNIEDFHKNTIKRKVVVPHVFWEYTTTKVLAMDYIEGKKLLNARLPKNLKSKMANELLIEMFHEVFEDGLFHADPHPGNLLLVDKNKLGILDFGIVGRINHQLKQRLKALFIGVMLKDVERIVNALIELDIVKSKVDKARLSNELYSELNEFYNQSVSNINISDFMYKCLGIAKRFNMKMPKSYVLLAKSFITMEGVCYRLDPNFNMFEASGPLIKKILSKQANPKYFVKQLKKDSIKFVSYLRSVPDLTEKAFEDIEYLDQTASKIDKDLVKLSKNISMSSKRLVVGIVIGACIVAFALTVDTLGTFSYLLLFFSMILLFGVLFGGPK